MALIDVVANKIGMARSILATRDLKGDSVVTVSPDIETIEPFQFKLPGHHAGNSNWKYYLGVYETTVLRCLRDRIDSDMTFWEIGARRGYFSTALARYCDEVVSVDVASEDLDCLRVSKDENGFDNIEIVNARVNDDFDPSAHPSPDIGLVDIEGYEKYFFSVGDDSPIWGAKWWVVELHDGEMIDMPALDIQSFVTDQLEEHGYRVEHLEGSRNHIVAEKIEKS